MLIAVDPGQHTGLAFRLDNGAWGTVLADKVPDANERLDMVLSLLSERLETKTCDALILENFKTMGYLSRYGIETIELIGAIKGLCHVHNVPLARQDPQHRLAFVPQATRMLKERQDTLSVPVSDHEVSALAHLLHYEYVQEMRANKSAASAATLNTTPGNTKMTVRRI